MHLPGSESLVTCIPRGFQNVNRATASIPCTIKNVVPSTAKGNGTQNFDKLNCDMFTASPGCFIIALFIHHNSYHKYG